MNTLKTVTRLGVFAGLLLTVLTACGAPKIMLGESFLPETNKVARESLKVSADSGGNKGDLTHYYIQVCDVSGARESNCKTTLVLENITNYVVRRGL